MNNIPLSKYFTTHEGIYLPTWNREATTADGLDDVVLANLTALFVKMDTIREHFSMPVIVHCAFRPEAYNTLVGGAPDSAHKYGKAVDFHISPNTCDAVRSSILNNNLLETLDLRMENRPGSGWVHLGNDWEPGKSRFFLP